MFLGYEGFSHFGQRQAGPLAGGNGSNAYTVQHGDSLWNISDRMRAAGDSRGNWDPNSSLQGTAQGPGAQGDGVPWIGQMNPAGADGNYQNAAQSCGPAVMAMLAREHGLGGGMSDAQLISSLGQTGHTDASGTTGNGLIAMADQMGLKSAAEPGANSPWVMSQLAQGKDVVANGNYYALPQHADPNQTSAHYILLTGLDKNGNITVEDPMDPSVRSITPGQLDQFNNGQPQGGFNIAFG